jgi:hypothetical protein
LRGLSEMSSRSLTTVHPPVRPGARDRHRRACRHPRRWRQDRCGHRHRDPRSRIPRSAASATTSPAVKPLWAIRCPHPVITSTPQWPQGTGTCGPRAISAATRPRSAHLPYRLARHRSWHQWAARQALHSPSRRSQMPVAVPSRRGSRNGRTVSRASSSVRAVGRSDSAAAAA